MTDFGHQPTMVTVRLVLYFVCVCLESCGIVAKWLKLVFGMRVITEHSYFILDGVWKGMETSHWRWVLDLQNIRLLALLIYYKSRSGYVTFVRCLGCLF